MATKPQVKANDQAMDNMAEEGRVTDNVMAHLTNGEIVIPLTIAHNKKAVQMIAMMFELAGEDIEQFVVGSPKQKINPETGHPEFFSLGSVWHAVTAPVKAAGNVVKDVVNTTIDVGKTIVNTGGNVVSDLAKGDVGAALSDTVSGTKDVGSELVSGAKQGIKDALTGAQKTLVYAMDGIGILPHAPAPDQGGSGAGDSSPTTITQGQDQRSNSLNDQTVLGGGGGSGSITARTVSGPDNDYKLNKSAVLGL